MMISLKKTKIKGISLLLFLGVFLAGLAFILFTGSLKAYAYGPYTASTDFSSTQGTNQWYYQNRAIGTSTYTNMTNTSVITGYGTIWWGGAVNTSNWINSNKLHPDNSNDSVRKWVVPASGTVSITGRAYKSDTGGGNGVVVSVLKNSTSLWSQTIAYNDSTGYTTDSALSSVAVTAGDAIYFIANNNGDWANDEVAWDPTISYATTGGPAGYTYCADENQTCSFSGTASVAYGANGTFNYGSYSTSVGCNNGVFGDPIPGVAKKCYYQATAPGLINDNGSGVTYSGTWGYDNSGSRSGDYNGDIHYTATNGDYVQYTFTGTGVDYINDTANDLGNVDIYIDSVFKQTVSQNSATRLYQQTLYSNTGLSSGTHTIKIVKKDGSWASIDALKIYTSSPPAWNLNTDDTNLTLAIISNRPAITQLKNSTQNWNWTPNTAVLPLINKVYIGGTAYTPNWTYQSAAVDTSVGTKVTLTFTSTTPSLTLTQIWWARPGVGPVEESTAITNNTGGNLTYNYIDTVAADLTVTSDNTVTLTRFDRASYHPSAAGVYTDTLSSSSDIESVVSNDYTTGAYVLPYVMLDRGNVHGLYMGYNWDFGRFANTTSGNALQIRNKFYLGDYGSVTEANGKVFNVPGMFFGTYKGDIDTGSNAMKKWFWNYKITPSLKANTNEPSVFFNIPLYTESEMTSFLAANPLSTWGVDVMQMDAWYTSDVNDPSQQYFGWGWTPDPAKWPSGMTLGTKAHNNGLLLSIYMGNRYNHADLATQTGRDSEKSALLYRYDNWHYDTFRSDMEFEPTNDYLSHEGFLEVLDYMIANRPNFRWQNCSGGGSKKSFDLLQRQSSATTEDSGAETGSVENYRRAFYGNSYMINPVQLGGANIVDNNTPTQAYYEMRSSMMGEWMYGSWGSTVRQSAIYQTNIALYKTKQRPIIRGGDTYHILPMPDGTNWDGMEFFNTTLNKGSVFLFHPSASAPTSKTIVFKGLNSAANYSLTFQDRTAQNVASISGATLMTTGITVTGMTGDIASEIIWIN
jgi:hypothetical protein